MNINHLQILTFWIWNFWQLDFCQTHACVINPVVNLWPEALTSFTEKATIFTHIFNVHALVLWSLKERFMLYYGAQ